jgi:Tfp pilus assembly protein FimT
MNWPRIDSLTRRSYALAHRLQYSRGEAYALFLNPNSSDSLRSKTVAKGFDYGQWGRSWSA